VVIIVGTHLDQIPQSEHETLIRRYERLILQCFSNDYCPDLPNYWPKIASIKFVGLMQQRILAEYLNVDELRDIIYDTALHLYLPIGMYACVCVNTCNCIHKVEYIDIQSCVANLRFVPVYIVGRPS